MLDKTATFFQANDERNYHIFYQMCTARDSSEFEDLKLKHPDEFLYLNQGDSPEIDGLDDAEEFAATRDAFKVGVYYLLYPKS